MFFMINAGSVGVLYLMAHARAEVCAKGFSGSTPSVTDFDVLDGTDA